MMFTEIWLIGTLFVIGWCIFDIANQDRGLPWVVVAIVVSFLIWPLALGYEVGKRLYIQND